MQLRFPSINRKNCIRLGLGMLTAFLLSAILLNLLFPLQADISYAQIVNARDGSIMHAFLSRDDKWRMKTELPEIIPQLKEVIIYKEDRYFYYHPGVNPLAITRAAFNNLIQGRKTSGASTITMQVARLLAPKQRTYLNKLAEIFRALQLEWYFSKDEILQLYLNLVPYGSNIEGVKAASLLYFGRMPEQLSLAQIVTLSIVPNRPTSLALGKNDTLLVQARNAWLHRLRVDNQFNDSEIDDALNEPLEAHRTAIPKLTPHLAYRLNRTNPDAAIVRTTIRPDLQANVQQLTFNYHKRIQRLNIHNMAVLVINNRTMEAEAYVGSPDFTDNNHAGQVDGIRAIRSPGSTLKPLVYALGIDAGKITPKTVLTDVPSNFAGFSPDNFDNKFNGQVTVEKALSHSLNVPAVQILDEVGVPLFVSRLKQAGFRQIHKDENKLGLSAVLGGCGVTLEELTGLFAAFANGGIYQPISYTFPAAATGDTLPGIPLISPAAAFMITDILTQATRPDLPNNYQSSYHVPRIAWKTGTSYGRRDAWSIGYNAAYTVGVWVGNASGEGVSELTGADIATPLLFSIFNSIDYNSAGNWFTAPDDLKFRLVCAESGLTPGRLCAHQIADYFIPLVSATGSCTHLKETAVSADESFAYCITCQPESGFKKKVYPNILPQLVAYYEASGIAYPKVPPHNPACTRVFEQGAPLIVSPADGLEYWLDPESPAEIMLNCQAMNDVKKVFWYINDAFYQAAEATEKVFFVPRAGAVKISCSDDKGRNTDVHIWVREQ